MYYQNCAKLLKTEQELFVLPLTAKQILKIFQDIGFQNPTQPARKKYTIKEGYQKYFHSFGNINMISKNRQTDALSNGENSYELLKFAAATSGTNTQAAIYIFDSNKFKTVLFTNCQTLT